MREVTSKISICTIVLWNKDEQAMFREGGLRSTEALRMRKELTMIPFYSISAERIIRLLYRDPSIVALLVGPFSLTILIRDV